MEQVVVDAHIPQIDELTTVPGRQQLGLGGLLVDVD
jgi:hypothetical protein